MPAPLTIRARAKINLTLRVLGRRADGYHELESLVAFAGTGDALSLEPGPQLSLTIDGPRGQGLPVDDSNLILRATRALEAETGPLRTGAFHLVKRLPVASGIGGGSADAAAALRLLARLNGLSPDDPALLRAAAATGADVPVCLASRARIMAGIGERLGPPLTLPPLFALLVNPGVPVETAPVFRALGLQPGQRHPLHSSLPDTSPHPEEPRSGVSKEGPEGAGTSAIIFRDALLRSAPQDEGSRGIGLDRAALLAALGAAGNDLEAPARRVAPVIDTVLAALRAQPGCRLARMSGSGATCFALFDDCRQSAAAGRALARAQSGWWVKPTLLR
ncbi:4-(cytidine 5'-diphospho)-2-C-methyl-D-erythritol kinase [Bosea sp. (in: a-proteobacteria)]|uniref:4-(cytidine 5'-diphospho)-2-C-methyl-D-erythritol kinase n=1 Tax=Bosea sp. (in: a-proteobacteria) TaxID=1871050 RepID=UPI002B485D47|nr:4-(cytidine 5'-diphospho)-2-C-methyl-D-erythritol kinase [Bosea sp. (in: a-proteobacteria)]WRH57979.1 MAG: 4-(cytidine 5'-diphospho)-2-C-methyl-D-erythritol kinase [Bosea sp. (in: a-proteobacteria)]